MQGEFQGTKAVHEGKPSTIVLTGAGISQSAGIPTFEEKPELRGILTVDYFKNNFEDFWKYVKEFEKTMENKTPTMAHRLLSNQREWLIVTMNMDSLHKIAGTKRLIEVNGDLEQVYCTECGKKYPFEIVEDTLYCKECGGKLRPKIVLSGDNVELYNSVMKEINLYSTVIIIGTSFTTNFAEQFKETAEELGKKLIIFNENADSQLIDYLIKQEKV